MLKVFILDGNSITRGLLSTVLTNGSHHVIGDSSISHTGIARMLRSRPQIICVDLASYDGNGMELVDSIRLELPKSMIFMVSSSFDEATIRNGLEHGIKGFIVKPFNSIRVLTIIRTAVIKFVKDQQQSRSLSESSVVPVGEEADTGMESLDMPVEPDEPDVTDNVRLGRQLGS